MSGKRKQDGGGGGGRPSKKKFLNKAPPSGSRAIATGGRGILISCMSGKEMQAGKEASALFTEAYEALGGTWKPAGAGGGGEAEAGGAPTDIAAALASEVAELRDASRQPLFYHTVGINSVVFLECRDAGGPSPGAMVQHVCAAVAATRENRTRFCNRFYPMEHVCYPSMDRIGELAAQVVAEHFPADAEQPIEFAVQYDARAAPPLDRMQVINLFAERVPKPHKVNLNAPQKTIVVNAIKSACGVAVVERYRELCRFNIRTLAMSDEEREAERLRNAPAAPKKEEEKEEQAEQQQAEQQQEEQQPTEGVAS